MSNLAHSTNTSFTCRERDEDVQRLVEKAEHLAGFDYT
jgi:hypothetical protein